MKVQVKWECDKESVPKFMAAWKAKCEEWKKHYDIESNNQNIGAEISLAGMKHVLWVMYGINFDSSGIDCIMYYLKRHKEIRAGVYPTSLPIHENSRIMEIFAQNLVNIEGTMLLHFNGYASSWNSTSTVTSGISIIECRAITSKTVGIDGIEYVPLLESKGSPHKISDGRVLVLEQSDYDKSEWWETWSDAEERAQKTETCVTNSMFPT